MTNKKFKKAAMALALTACVAATPLAANAETPENAAGAQAPAAVDHTEADTQEATEAELPVAEEPEAQPSAEAAAQPAAPEATPIAVELPTAEETPEEKEETPVEVTPTEDAVVEKEAPAEKPPVVLASAPAAAKANADIPMENPDADIAAEDPDADIATMDGAENAVSEDAATITGGKSYSTLDDALKDANAGDEVVLQKDHTGNITIAEWIKLNLNKHKIEGNVDVDLSGKKDDTATSQDGETAANKNTVEITGGTITGAKDSGVTIKDAGQTNVLLKDLTIEDNTGKKGGGVHIENSQNVTIDHCTIQNNKTTEVSPNTNASVDIGAGGGVFVSDNSHVTIQNGSTIQGNTGTRGGGIYTEHSTVEVKDSKIDGNTADDAPEKAPNSNKGLGGGIYSYESTLTVTDSTISGNEAKGSTSLIRYNSKDELSSSTLGNGGGGICAVGKKSDVTLDKVTVTGNKATSNVSTNLGAGGGIEAQGGTLTVKDSTISNNEAQGNGGGIFSAEGNELTVSGSTIQGNKADNGGGIHTGEARDASKTPSKATITDTKILENEAIGSGEGGGVYVGTRADATLKGCTVANNKSVSTGGGIASKLSTVTLDDTTVENNQAVNGGGLFHLGIAVPGSLTLQNGSIIRNNTASSMGGGLFLWGNVGLKSDNSEISGNKALYGAGIAASQYTANFASPKLELVDTKVNNNGDATTVMGGGIYAASGVTVTSKNTKFLGNTANTAGGILLYLNSSADLDNSEVSGNKATGNGGGVYVYDATCSLTTSNGTVFRENSAYSGGGIYSNGGAVTAEDSTFEKNTATTNGGGFYLQGTKLTANRNTIANNEAKSGGGIYLNVSSANLEGNTITENKATNGSGGGIYSYDATGEEKVALTLKNNTITKNEASSTGGGLAITNKNQTITLDGDIIEENTSKTYGGGIHMGSGSTMTMTGGSISKNHSDKLGGGIYGASRKKITLNGTKVQSNTANSGAGIYLYSKTELEAGEGTVISDNKANISGGGIFNSGSILTLKNGSVLENNTAGKFGGGLYNTGTTTVESGATLMNNTAEECGGGLYNKGKATVESGAKLYNNHAALAGDDIYLVGKNSTLTLTKVGDDWTLDDCGHKINGWFADLLDARWDADGKGEHVINLKDYAADGLTIVENEDGSYTITILDENTTLALKAAHNVIPKPTPDPDPEPTPTPGPVTPETPENPPVEDATPDEPAETPMTPENPTNPPVQDATPGTVAALPKTGVNWFTALAMALSGMALTVAGAFTSLFAKSKH